MTLELYYDTDASVEITLAEIGHRESNDYDNFTFSSKGGTGMGWTKHWSVGVRYDQLDIPIKLGTLLNDVNIASQPYGYKLTPNLQSQKGLISSNKTVNSGFTTFNFGPLSGLAPYVSVTCAVDIEYQNIYSSCYLAHGWIDEKEVIGFLGIDTRSAQYPSYLTPYFIYNEEYSDWLLSYAMPDPGKKGYKPTATRYDPDKKAGIGGKGHNPDPGKNPGYASDDISNPGAPDESSASVIGSGLVRAYKITKSNLGALAECLYGTTLFGLITNLSINPLDFIVSLNIFPCAPSVGSDTHLMLGKWECTDSGTGLGANVLGKPLTSQFKVIDFGSVDIYENWGSFLDYTHTQIELYLPFIGMVDIDTAEVMNGSIALSYTIDFLTGMCVANVNCNRTVELPDGRVKNQKSQHSFQGNCAMTVPLSQQSFGNILGSLINAGTAGMRGGLAGVGISVASDVASGGFKPSVTTKGSISANAGYCAVTFPYVRLTRPISGEPDSFQEVAGYPSYIDSKLADCDDLCICDSIDLHNITGATDSEIERIRQMCLEGVHV